MAIGDRASFDAVARALDQAGALAYGLPDPDTDDELETALSNRDADRVRLAKFVASHPDGAPLSSIVAHVLKGARPEQLEIAMSGSDTDYRFALRFLVDGAFEADPLFKIDRRDSLRYVAPTLRLVDLISQGITETGGVSNELAYDRDFCARMLRATRWDSTGGLSDSHKDHLADSLRHYLRRIENYRLLFDVHLDGWRGSSSRRMTKRYKTRWNDAGRIAKNFARFNQSLRWGFENAENAVIMTVTTDPKRFSIAEAYEEIGSNFHRLTQYLKSDPSTKADTRKEGVPSWTRGRESEVTGRPRKKLEYVKVLEAQDNGYPHLHVLFFDVPTREKDGMPWLIDKKELQKKWNDDYGQGLIVDTYPLTYRDDLDQVGNFGYRLVYDDDGELVRGDDGTPKQQPRKEGFVCWYQFGAHGHGDEWGREMSRYHADEGLISFKGDDDVLQQKTAGAYLGKYLSETFKVLHEHDPDDLDGDWNHSGKTAWWKLAMYWAMNRRFWTLSRGIEKGIERRDWLDDEARRGVTWATRDTLLWLTQECHPDHASLPDLDVEKAESTLHRLVKTLARVDYLGAYHISDLPPSTSSGPSLDDLEDAAADPSSQIELASTGDRPPPTAEVWG